MTPKIARTVFEFANGQIAVLDEDGREIPDLQGDNTPELRARIKERSDDLTEWN